MTTLANVLGTVLVITVIFLSVVLARIGDERDALRRKLDAAMKVVEVSRHFANERHNGDCEPAKGRCICGIFKLRDALAALESDPT